MDFLWRLVLQRDGVADHGECVLRVFWLCAHLLKTTLQKIQIFSVNDVFCLYLFERIFGTLRPTDFILTVIEHLVLHYHTA